jgi:hypothetical protein
MLVGPRIKLVRESWQSLRAKASHEIQMVEVLKNKPLRMSMRSIGRQATSRNLLSEKGSSRKLSIKGNSNKDILHKNSKTDLFRVNSGSKPDLLVHNSDNKTYDLKSHRSESKSNLPHSGSSKWNLLKSSSKVLAELKIRDDDEDEEHHDVARAQEEEELTWLGGMFFEQMFADMQKHDTSFSWPSNSHMAKKLGLAIDMIVKLATSSVQMQLEIRILAIRHIVLNISRDMLDTFGEALLYFLSKQLEWDNVHELDAINTSRKKEMEAWTWMWAHVKETFFDHLTSATETSAAL